MSKTTYLLLTIFIMHMMMLINTLVFDGSLNGIVMAVNTILLLLAAGLVLPIRKNPTE